MIKKILFLISFTLILNYYSNLNAKTYRIGTVFEDEISFSKNFVVPLSSGKWEVVDRYTDGYAFLYFKGNTIVKVENNEIMEMISIDRANTAGAVMGAIDSAINSIIFKDSYDGCYSRSEYLIVEVYKRGGTHNCLVVRHYDTNKELYTPDDKTSQSAQLKKWIKLGWLPLYPKIAGVLHNADVAVFTIITGSVGGLAYWASAKAISGMISHSSKINKAVYPKLLSGGKKEILEENLVRVFYFTFPLSIAAFVFAKPGLFALNPIY